MRQEVPVVFATSASLLFALASIIRIERKMRIVGETKLDFWLDNNRPKIILWYMICLLLFGSVSKDAIWTTDEIKDILTLEWTILGLSITIFLVWNILIIDYLRKKRPVELEESEYFHHYQELKEKQSFAQEVDSTWSSVVLLSINLILLLFSSSLVYIQHVPESVFTQNILKCSFFFSTNTIVSLFFDMLKPLLADKKALKADNQVTKKELDAALAEDFVHMFLAEMVKQIHNMSELSEEEQKQLSIQFLESFKADLLGRAKTTKSDKN